MNQILNIIYSAIAFVLTVAIAFATGNTIVINAVLIAFSIQWLAFIPAYVFQTEKFYDLTGSLTYISVVIYTLISSLKLHTEINLFSMLLATLIIIWAVRLGSFLFLRIHKDGEDKRFRTIKPSPTQFFMTWTLQGMWVSICSLCAITAISSPNGVEINMITIVGILLWAYGFYIEVKADNEKSQFRNKPENKNKFIKTGLWAKSRHPNYAGEIILWLGIALASYSSLEGTQLITLISPIFTYLLLVYVSGVRMLEARGQKRWGNNNSYNEYIRSTPKIFFNPFK